jgi:hypothetical protein
METSQAISIVRALANGLDPQDGAALDVRSPLRRHEVIVALNRALTALMQVDERERNRPDNAGKAWSREEDAHICNELSRGMTLYQLADSHQRSVGSIVARLVKLGKILPPAGTAAPSPRSSRPQSQRSEILNTDPLPGKTPH